MLPASVFMCLCVCWCVFGIEVELADFVRLSSSVPAHCCNNHPQ